MSGVLGIWNRDGRPVDLALLARLSAEQAHRGADGEGRWVDGNVGFAAQNLWVTPEAIGETQPVHRHGIVTLFDGRLDNRDDILASLPPQDADAGSSDAVLVAATYRKFGEGFAERLNGDFAVAVFDAAARRLMLARDGMGMRPLYYTDTGATVLAGSECKPLLAHPDVKRQPNADMIAAYLLACTGHEREGWTFFDGIVSVRPGQLVVVREQGISKRTYWDLTPGPGLRLKRFDDYVEGFSHHFDRAVARRCRSAYPVAVAVSGGLDSSSILCAALRLRSTGAVRADVGGIGFEGHGPNLDETRYLDAIERQYGIEIQRLPYRFAGLLDGPVRDGIRTMEIPYLRGLIDFEYPLHRTAHQGGARVLLTGTFGDHLLAKGDYRIDLFRRGRWLKLARDLGEARHWEPTISTGDRVRDLANDLVRTYIPRRLLPRLRALRQRLSGDRSWYSADLWQRARRAEALQTFAARGSQHQQSLYHDVRGMYYGLVLDAISHISAQWNTEQAFPFLDRELVQFVMAVPGEITSHKGVPKALLRAAMHGTLPEEIERRRWKAEGTREFDTSVEQAFTMIAGVLDSNPMCVSLQFVDAARLQPALHTLLNTLDEGECRYTRQLTDMFALELWLQCFCESKDERI